MNHSGTKVVFFGNERLVSGLPRTDAPTLRMLIDEGYDVCAIVSHHSEELSRKKRPLEVAEIAVHYNIPFFNPNRPADIAVELQALNAPIAVLVAYGRIIPQSIIDLFPLGIINVHPSLLPRYRGSTPIESAVLSGDDQTGVSVMQLTAGMDEGPVFAQATIPLTKKETKFDVYNTLAPLGAQLIKDTLPNILNGTLKPTPQADSQATYCKTLTKQDGVIDWSLSADQIERNIRGFIEWPGSRTMLNRLDVIITSAQVVSGSGEPGKYAVNGKELIIYTGKNALSIKSLKPAGKKEMPITAFLAGYSKYL